MRPSRVGVAIAGLAAVGLVAAGCQDDVRSDDARSTEASPATASTTTATTTPSADNTVTTSASEPTPPTDDASTTAEPPATTGPPTTSPPTTAEPTTTNPPTTSPPTSSSTTTTVVANACVAGLPVREMAALVTWPAVVTGDWDGARTVVGELGVGGVLLMSPGADVSQDDLTGLLDELDRLSPHGVLVASDEEGGTVQRLRQYRPLASQRDVAATMSPDEAARLIADHGEFVRRVGVDVVLGPVVDVAPTDGSPALGASRFFSSSPDDVTAYAAAYVDGWSANGLLPTLKHFPGHGAASADTHDALGVTAPLSELEARDLVPYRTLAPGAGRDDHPPVAIMVGHLDVPGLTDAEPASLSPAAVGFLRDDVGFDDALVISDALEMGAVDLPLAEAAVASIGAGVDVVLFSDTGATGSVIDAIVAAVDGGALGQDRLADAADRVLRSRRDRDCGSDNP